MEGNIKARIKARIKATGEIIEVATYSAVYELEGTGRRFNFDEVELVEDDSTVGPIDSQELKAKFQKLAAAAEELANDFAQLESNIRSFQNDVFSEAERVMKKGPNAGV